MAVPARSRSPSQNDDLWNEVAYWPTRSSTTEGCDSGKVLSSLGLVYLQHGDELRALVLGLSALSLGDASPRTGLLIADALLKKGDPEQTLAVLSRFEGTAEKLSNPPNETETKAKDYLKAIALYRCGDLAAAKMALTKLNAQGPK